MIERKGNVILPCWLQKPEKRDAYRQRGLLTMSEASLLGPF